MYQPAGSVTAITSQYNCVLKFSNLSYRTFDMPKYRGQQNRNPEAGMRNRQMGLGKKANTYKQFYGGDVLLLMRRQNGQIFGYQSRDGLIRDMTTWRVLESDLCTPDDFEKVSERRHLRSSRSPASSTFSAGQSPQTPSSDLSDSTLRNTPIQQGAGFCREAGLSLEAKLDFTTTREKVLQPSPLSMTQKRKIESLLETCFT